MDSTNSAVERLDVAAAPEDVRTLLTRVVAAGRTVVFEEHGQETAALVSAVDLERLRSLNRQRVERFSVIEELHHRNRHLDPVEAEQEIADEIAAMRAEERASAATPSRT